jgi:hypothetical protein
MSIDANHGTDANQLSWGTTKYWDSQTGTWSNGNNTLLGPQSGAFSAMLPLTPPYNKVQILQAGGVLGSSPGGEIATPLSEMITLDGTNNWAASSDLTGNLNNPRWYSSAVVLPNGEVVAMSGADKDEVVVPGTEKAVHQLELFNPNVVDPTTGKQGTWTPLSDDARDRTYHNSAMLLPDGSILIAGHAPINGPFYPGNANKDNWSLGGSADASANNIASNNFKDPSFERFFPPYLSGQRPAIAYSTGHTLVGGEVDVTTKAPEADVFAPVDHFVLSRMPSVTHTTDADNRTVVVDATEGTPNNWSFTLPDGNIVPPGFYYVFAMSADGTPSVATILQVTTNPAYFLNRPGTNEGGPNTVAPIQLIGQPLRASDPTAWR